MSKKTNHTLPIFILCIFIIVFTLYVLVLPITLYILEFDVSDLNKDNFGQIGDLLGGLVNPILTFFTIGLLVWSIQIQLKELKLTRQELSESAKSQKIIASNAEKDYAVNMAEKALEFYRSSIKNSNIRIVAYNREKQSMILLKERHIEKYENKDDFAISNFYTVLNNKQISKFSSSQKRSMLALLGWSVSGLANINSLIHHQAWNRAVSNNTIFNIIVVLIKYEILLNEEVHPSSGMKGKVLYEQIRTLLKDNNLELRKIPLTELKPYQTHFIKTLLNWNDRTLDLLV